MSETASFVRQQVIRKPNISVEELCDAWAESGGAKSDEPTPQQVYTARSTLLQKYEVGSLEQIPRKPNGDLNTTGLIRLLLKKDPNLTENACRLRLKADGVELSSDLWRKVKQQVRAESGTYSPDQNQDKGPRARKQGKRGRPKGSVNKAKGESASTVEDSQSRLERLEDQLDALIQEAKSISNSDVISALKDARRRISSQLVR